jgi:mono/diheme cytochrome c family protein
MNMKSHLSSSCFSKSRLFAAATAAALGLIWAGCQPAPGPDTVAQQGAAFRLPSGDAEKGKAAFLKLQCHACHQVAGADLPAPGSKSPITVVLGGEVLKVKTYDELVTSIINPPHIVSDKYRGLLVAGQTPMPEFNDSMSVAQLIDIVAFLHARYQKFLPAESGTR